MNPAEQTRIVQIHPTRRCNLRCRHCYSSSSPQERDVLDVALLFDAITDAAALGYDWISFSGGEPLLYRPLPQLLRHTRSQGMRTAMATNGMLLDERHLDAIAPCIDLIAISIDGIPKSHNYIRAHDNAFEIMASHLENLRQRGMPFGFIFTLTQHNLHELQWVADFAIEQGAKLLQIHPLDEVGYAVDNMNGETPDHIENAYAWMLGQQIQRTSGGRLAVQVDLVFSKHLQAHPELFYADVVPQHENARLGELVSPLIIEADGTVAPLQYGFPRAYALGNLADARLTSLADSWCRNSLADFHALCRAAYEQVTNGTPPHFISWYDTVAKLGRSSSPVMVANGAGNSLLLQKGKSLVHMTNR